MEPVTFKVKLRYLFDNILAKGTIAIIGLLAAFSALVIGIAASVVYFARVDHPEGDGMTLPEAGWQSFLHAIDAGTVAGDTGWPLRIVMLFVTLSGIFFVSILIGTITSGLESKLSDLRKGRSKVVESNHTLILGWSSKIFSIISELITANENQKNPRIVILAQKDKVEMDDEIKARLPNTRNTKIICRTGNPLDLTDLEVVSPNEAKSVIVLSPEGEHPDTDVIKSILALTNNPNRNGHKFHIVAELQNAENIEAAELVGRDEATLVLSSDLIAKVTAQTCRQSGLSMVYTELLDFDGAEIYFALEPALVGKTYKQALIGYEKSAVIGLKRATGQTLLNPAMETVISDGDKIIAISLDDDTVVFSGDREIRSNGLAVSEKKTESARERTLVLGWNERGSAIVKELDHYVAHGSEVVVTSELAIESEYIENLRSQLKNQSIVFKEGNVADRRTLEALRVEEFDHIIILCYQHLAIQQADAKTLIALLHLRKIAEQVGKDFSIVSEMLDIKNRELAEVAKADDFIVSDKLVSLMLSQLAENGELKMVFDQLFASEGSEIYLKPIDRYLGTTEETDFYTLVENAALHGETAIGYRKHSLAHDASQSYGVFVNPSKSGRITLSSEDRLIVLAES